MDEIKDATGDVLSFPSKPRAKSHPVLAANNESYSAVVEQRNKLRREVHFLRQRIFDLERLADTDPLLPIHNRRAFMREISRALSAHERYNSISTIIYFDVDRLKHINDKWGHVFGDRALLHVAEALSSGVRNSDMAARIGGDEFAVLLFQVDESAARKKAERLAEAISAHEISVPGGHFNISVTFGVRELDPSQTAESILAVADERMYSDKNSV